MRGPPAAPRAKIRGLKTSTPSPSRAPRSLSARALSTPEPYVRFFSRRVQQEGALDLTQGDYKNADFKPHPEVVRAAQRITRNTVHSYGPAVGRMDVRSEVAEFFNRDGLLDYPASEVRFLPDEVLFTPGTRAGLAFVLEVLGEDGSGVVVPRPSWEYDWFVERAGKKARRAADRGPRLPARPERARPAPREGRDLVRHPEQPAQPDRPRLPARPRRGARAGRGEAPRLRPLRLGLPAARLRRLVRQPRLREPRVARLGGHAVGPFEDGHVRRLDWRPRLLDGASRTRSASNGVKAREILANLSAWLVATPSTLAQDWALAALQSPLAALRRPSPYMRERRDFMAKAADELASLGVERTDFGGTFYSPLAFPGLVGEPFDRLRHGVHEKAVVKDSVDAFEFLLAGGVGGIPFVAFAGGAKGAARYGTWQRLSYGSKDVKELAVFIDRVRATLTKQARLGSSAPAGPRARCRTAHDGRLGERLHGRALRRARRPRREGVRGGAQALPARTRATRRCGSPARSTPTRPRTAPSSSRAPWPPPATDAAAGRPRRAHATSSGTRSWRRSLEYEETIRDLLGPCSEVLLDLEGRQISPDWLDVPEKVVLALLRHGIVPGEDRHLLFRVPNPFIEQDEEKVSKILASVARANVLFHLACEQLGIEPKQNAIHEITVPQVNSSAEIGAVVKIGSLYRKAAAGLFEAAGEQRDDVPRRAASPRRGAPRSLEPRPARAARAAVRERRRPRAAARPPRGVLPRARARQRAPRTSRRPRPSAPRFDRAEATVRVFVAMSDTAEQSGKIATDAASPSPSPGARRPSAGSRPTRGSVGEPAPVGDLPRRRRPRRLPRRLRPGAPGRPAPVRARRRRHGAGHPRRLARRARSGSPPRSAPRSRRGRRSRAPSCRSPTPTRCRSCSRRASRAHTETLLRIAPLLAPFGSLVPQTRVRIRATGSVNYGRSIPTYPEEWGGGTALPDNRDLRDAWPEGVTLPRAIVYNLACTTLGLPAVTSDLVALDRRAAVLLDRHAPGLPRDRRRASCPASSRSRPASSSGRSSRRRRPAAASAPRPRCGSTPARARSSSPRRASSPWSTCATSPRTRRAGTRRRSTRARRRARRSSSARPRASPSPPSARSGPATAGPSCSPSSTPRTPRASSSPAS